MAGRAGEAGLEPPQSESLPIVTPQNRLMRALLLC